VLGRVEKNLCHGSGISQDLKVKKEEKRSAAAAAHCSYYPVPALKCWAKERNDHYRGLKTFSINQ
jgi:hypothetical protein